MAVGLDRWARKQEYDVRERPAQVHNVPTGEQLYARRRALNATRELVGNLTGLRTAEIYDVECDVDTSIAKRQKISDALGVLEGRA